VDIAAWVQNYGYLAVAAGAFLEGETVVIAAGAAASAGYVALPAVIAVAAFASFAGDQLYFHVGRRYGAWLLGRSAFLRARSQRVRELLERHHTPLILSIRFLYGLRIAGPIAIGMSDVARQRFAVLNLLGAIAWATAIAAAGYWFTQALTRLRTGLDADELWASLAIVLFALLCRLLMRRWRSSRAAR